MDFISSSLLLTCQLQHAPKNGFTFVNHSKEQALVILYRRIEDIDTVIFLGLSNPARRGPFVEHIIPSDMCVWFQTGAKPGLVQPKSKVSNVTALNMDTTMPVTYKYTYDERWFGQ